MSGLRNCGTYTNFFLWNAFKATQMSTIEQRIEQNANTKQNVDPRDYWSPIVQTLNLRLSLQIHRFNYLISKSCFKSLEFVDLNAQREHVILSLRSDWNCQYCSSPANWKRFAHTAPGSPLLLSSPPSPWPEQKVSHKGPMEQNCRRPGFRVRACSRADGIVPLAHWRKCSHWWPLLTMSVYHQLALLNSWSIEAS